MTGTHKWPDRPLPVANPHMHSSWNSNNPESSSMEFHRQGGRQINHRASERDTVYHKDRKRLRTVQKKNGGEAAKRGSDMKITRAGPTAGPLWPRWQFVRYSTLPNMAAPLGYSCRKLLWEPCRHRLLLHFLSTWLNSTILTERRVCVRVSASGRCRARRLINSSPNTLRCKNKPPSYQVILS